MSKNYEKRRRLQHLEAQLDNERVSFESHWRELNDYINPRRARFFTEDTNKGDRRNNKILDSTGTLAMRTLRSGMMAGVTSPARPWFRLSVPDHELKEVESVKTWLHKTTKKMADVFLRSNLYNVLPTIYGDIGTFATAAMLVEEDFDSVIRCYPFPIGSYAIANDDKLKINTFKREFRLTVRQVIDKFGRIDPDDPSKIVWDNISMRVKSLYDSGNTEAWVDICHIIRQNPDYDPSKLESKYKKYESVYFEQGADSKNSRDVYLGADDLDKFLLEEGFDYFPVLAPRWQITGEDIYGTECPGMDALGDIKQLQTAERRGLQAIEKMINPPMIGPSSLKGKKISILPGDITYEDETGSGGGLRPAHEVNFNITALEQKQQQVRQRISRAFYEDLFLMLANSDRRQITAREIEERHEEKLLALGPVLEQLNQDLLDPLIDITFNIMLQQDLIDEPPPELEGRDLKVEYISIMAQAQKLVGIGAIERFTGYVGSVASYDPGVLQKVNADQLIDEYADIVSIAPGIVKSDEQVAEERAEIQRQQMAQAQAEQMAQMASTAKNLSQAEVGGDQQTALDAIAQGLS